MPVHILAGAAVLGLAVAGTAETVAWWQARIERAAILARIHAPRLTVEERAEAEAAFAAEVALLLHASGVRLDMTIDRWQSVHYRTVPQTAPHASITHLVDTQPHSAVTATRPMLPAVPAVTRGELQRARFYDMGRAG